jgi:ABC-2 type transport system permease protein
MDLRSRELKLRLLDKKAIRDERLLWQMINVAGPVLVMVIAGLIYNLIRRRKYTRA